MPRRQMARAIARNDQSGVRKVAFLSVLTLALIWGQLAKAEEIIRSHGYSYFGDLAYPADYPHFNYVNPDAPKGGEISVWASGTFDSLNPYTVKGRAGRYSNMMYEGLLGDMPASNGGAPADQIGEYYGLLAESLEYPESKDWVIFYMRPEARFSDGTPVTAHDVVFSHKLFLEQGLPSYAQAVSRLVPTAEALDDHTVKFTFAEGESRRSLVETVGSTTVFSKKWFEETGARLDESRMETSPGSGPYVLDSYDVNRSITYRRNPDYWGADLPINQGRHNFDVIRVEYFADSSAAFEAFKAGEYTFRAETNSKQWATGYDFPTLENGSVVKEELPDGNPPTPAGIVFNLAKPQFSDPRVREAISLAYNFEWSNETLQYGLFSQRHSFVQDTPLQANDLPAGPERALLEGLGDIVPDAVMNEPAVTAHTSQSRRPLDRRNLRRALQLFEEAGWSVGTDGKLRNGEGKTLQAEIIISTSGSDTAESLVEAFVQNLQAMGVDARTDKIDPSQYTLRRRERDYDLIMSSYTTFLSAGAGLSQWYGSAEAEFSVFNAAGLASPLVDEVIKVSLDTTNREDQDVALMALDRVLRYERFMIPTYYNDSYWVAYYDMYEYPENLPPYELGVLDFWWYNAEKGQALRTTGALR